MLSKNFRYAWFITWVAGFYIVQHNSLRIAAPCGLTIDIISAVLIFLGVNKSCYLLWKFYSWYKGNDRNANKQ